MKQDPTYKGLESLGQLGDRLAKPPPEEPDAGNPHVRVCEGPGRQRPGLLGKAGDAVRLFVAAVAVGTFARTVSGASLGELLADLKSPKPETRIAAAKAVRELGKEAGPAAADLVPLLKDEYQDVRRSVRETLVEIGKPAVPLLVKALDDEHWHSRCNALVALGMLGPDAAAAADRVRSLLRDPSGDVRRLACGTLQRIGSPSRQLTQDLAALLDDSMAAADAEAALRELLRGSTDATRDAAEPLKPLVAKASGERLALLSGLLNAAGVRVGFEQILAQYEADREGKNEWFCKTIETGGFPAETVVPLLVRELKAGMDTYSEWSVARLCIALGRFGPGAEPAVQDLTAALKHKKEGVRRYAAQALGNIGKPAASALPDLRTLAEKDPEGRVREWAAEAVKKVEGTK